MKPRPTSKELDSSADHLEPDILSTASKLDTGTWAPVSPFCKHSVDLKKIEHSLVINLLTANAYFV